MKTVKESSSFSSGPFKASFAVVSADLGDSAMIRFVDFENPERSWENTETKESIATRDAQQRALVKIGSWAAPCCCQDAEETTNQSQVNEILENWELGWSVYPDKETAWDALCDCSEKDKCSTFAPKKEIKN